MLRPVAGTARPSPFSTHITPGSHPFSGTGAQTSVVFTLGSVPSPPFPPLTRRLLSEEWLPRLNVAQAPLLIPAAPVTDCWLSCGRSLWLRFRTSLGLPFPVCGVRVWIRDALASTSPDGERMGTPRAHLAPFGRRPEGPGTPRDDRPVPWAWAREARLQGPGLVPLVSSKSRGFFLFPPPGTYEGVAKSSAATTRQPRARDQDRKKGSLTSSLRMEPHSRSGRSRKATKFRSISRSLVLCNAKASDDGSSPDEQGPGPFEVSRGRGEEGVFHSPEQLADTSEAGPGSVPDLTLCSEAAVRAAGRDRGKNGRRMFFTKVLLGRGLVSGVVSWRLRALLFQRQESTGFAFRTKARRNLRQGPLE